MLWIYSITFEICIDVEWSREGNEEGEGWDIASFSDMVTKHSLSHKFIRILNGG